MKLDKAEVATRLLVAMVGRGEALPGDHSIIAKWCWSMADAMQAEADKHAKEDAIKGRERIRELLNIDTTFVSREGEHFDDLNSTNSSQLEYLKFEDGRDYPDDAKVIYNGVVCLAKFAKWQPDWSQAPEWANWWAMDRDLSCYWHSCELPPYIIDGGTVFECGDSMGHTFEAQNFGYHDYWKNSLRKRPEGK